MSVTYRAVGWNPQKRKYDAVLGAGVGLYLATFVGAGLVFRPTLTAETLIIRALGSAAFLLLHVILCIGPLTRLDERFLPLLYNRRHLGVTMCLLALSHGSFAVFQFHALGNVPALVSLLTTSTDYTSVSRFPFQVAGLGALVILFLMGATSHDFWLRTLTPPVWKSLHMLVYAAYTLLVAHVGFGLLQSDRSPLLAALVGCGALVVVSVHTAAARRERRIDGCDLGRERATTAAEAAEPRWVDVCAVSDLEEKRGRIVCAAGERIAVFRYDGLVSAVSNVCQHQNGPLGEGRIVGSCIVCPWHGYEYRPDTGASPPPFTEKVPTFSVAVRDGRVLVDPRPHPPGTAVEPARIPS